MYEKVLLPTDGSVGAQRGLERAIDIAERFGAELHLLYVVDERILGSTPALSGDELFFESQAEWGEATLAEAAAEARASGVETETSCVRGTPYDAILRYVADNDVDLVVMGRHGRRDRGRPHIGSSTDRVLRASTVPVMPV
jgi:nucleotide-binding universal stress UspA family protein